MPDQNMRILVVDDFQTMRRIVRGVLKDIGFTNVVEADNGVRALEVLKTEKIDFIVSDWNMPEMSGLDLTKWVRANQQFAEIPILMITTRGNKEDVIEAMKMRVNNYIVKPFTAPGLKEKIDQILKTVGTGAA